MSLAPDNIPAFYAKYLEYIKNTGGSPGVECFDEDWQPIGPQIRDEMEALGLIVVIENNIHIAQP